MFVRARACGILTVAVIASVISTAGAAQAETVPAPAPSGDVIDQPAPPPGVTPFTPPQVPEGTFDPIPTEPVSTEVPTVRPEAPVGTAHFESTRPPGTTVQYFRPEGGTTTYRGTDGEVPQDVAPEPRDVEPAEESAQLAPASPSPAVPTASPSPGGSDRVTLPHRWSGRIGGTGCSRIPDVRAESARARRAGSDHRTHRPRRRSGDHGVPRTGVRSRGESGGAVVCERFRRPCSASSEPAPDRGRGCVSRPGRRRDDRLRAVGVVELSARARGIRPEAAAPANAGLRQ